MPRSASAYTVGVGSGVSSWPSRWTGGPKRKPLHLEPASFRSLCIAAFMHGGGRTREEAERLADEAMKHECDREGVVARGLCRACYDLARNRGEEMPPTIYQPREGPCQTCGGGPIKARRLCEACYFRERWRRTHPLGGTRAVAS